MRKLIILSLIISLKCFGQGIITFADTNATWNVAKTFPNGTSQDPNFVSTVTKTYGYKGDTVIGSVLWTNMFFTPDSNFSTTLNLKRAGYLNTSNDFVFYMDTLFNLDTIYNFNLQIGDSVKYDFGSGDNYLFVTNLDSTIIDGSYHKRFFFSEPTGSNAFTILNEIWIEGIGSIHGPLFPINPTMFSTEIPDSMNLTCYKINGSIIWNNPNYNDCFINIVLSVNDLQETQWNIFTYPNPVTNELRIELPKSVKENFEISIFDLEGKLINKNFENRNGQITIDTRTLKNKYYILQVQCGKGTYRTKFTKQ
jgi:hypothetical protein